MTSSEQRLHPASILFDIARYARIFAWPALIAYMSGPRGRMPGMDRFDYDFSPIETWLWLLVLPSVGLSIVRYLTFRVRYEPTELVIKSGLLFRNVRHVPYARIQNLDAVQNIVHRALGVVDVRVETGGGGSEPEARMKVLPVGAVDEMRARVFARRHAPAVDAIGSLATDTIPEGVAAPDHAQGSIRPLLRLSLGDLLLLGVLENKGLVLVGAAYGALWETGLMNRIWRWMFVGAIDARGLYRDLLGFLGGREPLPSGRLALALGGLAVLLVLVRLVSMAWAILRLYDFTLTRSGDDLRVTYGLLTRVSATIPLRRVQVVTIRRGWLYRRLGRASIRVETAGGRAGAAMRDREWLAPIIREAEVGALVAEVVPGVALPGDGWRGVHPRAFARALTRAWLRALVPSAALLAVLGWRGLLVAVPLLAWAAIAARQYVRHLAWALSDVAVAFRSGWLMRADTVVRANRIQGVTLRESPFDRRARMASVRIDTAGAGEWSHRVDIPYLDAALARDVQEQLVRSAARTSFQW